MNPLAYAFLNDPLPAHSRSTSLGPQQPAASPTTTSKTKSTTDLNAMSAEVAIAPTPAAHEVAFRTITDPRNSSASDLSRSGSISSRQPNVSTEVTTLSDKLVSAIEHNTSLDETLAQTRRELEASRARIAQLEAESKAHEEKITRGDLLTKHDVDQLHSNLSAELAEERKQRGLAQQEKRGMEGELENLTASLFDEANKMVAAANRQCDTAEKKNQQLRDQIKDGEAVIASQTEQLTELKMLMQVIGSEHRKELDSPYPSLAPSSPATAKEENNLVRLLEAMNLTPVSAENGDIAPSPSMAFTHLLKSQCRIDIPAYEDFRNLVQTSFVRSHTPSHAPSRAGSGTYGGLNVMGLGPGANNSNPNLPQVSQPATSKLANSPSIPGSFSPSMDNKGPVPLKDTRFFKRIMAEDVEPTLRLDLSPTISWLNRRSILAALTDSSLIVEPIPEASLKLYGKYTPCAMCGENRKEGQNPRTHAMRTRDGEGATKWLICNLCLEKVRGVGDLVAYVRMVREGVVKCGDQKEEEEAWEELVRLRERLFWARMAGGVVPSFLPSTKNSPVAGAGEKGGNEKPAGHDEESTTPGFETPNMSRRTSDKSDGTKSEREAQLQLQKGLDESLTTFENIKDKRVSLNNAAATTPPSTPPRKKESGGTGFPKISIPRIPDTFWSGQVNTLR